jgi:hypothetical protein
MRKVWPSSRFRHILKNTSDVIAIVAVAIRKQRSVMRTEYEECAGDIVSIQLGSWNIGIRFNGMRNFDALSSSERLAFFSSENHGSVA